MQQCGVSGVYFRILKPGKISLTDTVERTELAQHRCSIADLYRKLIAKEKLDLAEQELLRKNGSLPENIFARLI